MADEFSGAGGIYPAGSFYQGIANRLSTLEQTVGTSLGAVTAAEQAQAAATAANTAATNAQNALDTVIANTADIAATAAAAAEDQVNSAAAAALASAQASADAAAADVAATAAAALADAQAAAAAAEAAASAAGDFDPVNYYQKAEVDALVSSGGVKIGQSIMWNNDDPASIPEGFFKENGAAYSRTVYHELFAAIGTKHGAGDGSTTFNVPDTRGAFPRGLDDGRGIDVGRTIGSDQADQNKEHTHSVTGTAASAGAHSHAVSIRNNGNTTGYAAVTGNSSANDSVYTGSAGAHTHSVTGTAASDGGSEARPYNVAKLFLIRAY